MDFGFTLLTKKNAENFLKARVRNKGGGYSEFEPIHTGSEDEGNCQKATILNFIKFTFFNSSLNQTLAKDNTRRGDCITIFSRSSNRLIKSYR